MKEARAIVALNLDDILFMTNNKFSDPRIAKCFIEFMEDFKTTFESSREKFAKEWKEDSKMAKKYQHFSDFLIGEKIADFDQFKREYGHWFYKPLGNYAYFAYERLSNFFDQFRDDYLHEMDVDEIIRKTKPDVVIYNGDGLRSKKASIIDFNYQQQIRGISNRTFKNVQTARPHLVLDFYKLWCFDENDKINIK